MDPDTKAVMDQLQSALTASGLSQADFARALGTSPSRFSTYMTGKVSPAATFLIRSMRIGAALARTHESRVPTALAFAAAISRALDEQNEHWALALSLEARDRLRETLASRPDLADAWSAEPHTGSERWDTLLAALTKHEFELAGHPSPRWAADRRLATPWTIGGEFRDLNEIESQTPPWLAEHGIALRERDLATA